MVRIGALPSPGIFNGMMWVNRLVASSESGMYSDQSSRQVSPSPRVRSRAAAPRHPDRATATGFQTGEVPGDGAADRERGTSYAGERRPGQLGTVRYPTTLGTHLNPVIRRTGDPNSPTGECAPSTRDSSDH